VIPVDEQFELILKSCLAHRDQPSTCSLAFHRPDEPFDDRDTAVLPNGAEPWLDRPATAPGLVAVAPELPPLSLMRCLGDAPEAWMVLSRNIWMSSEEGRLLKTAKPMTRRE
jgi:hypothetical protein